MEILTFRVWTPYAHFRRPYTTRSPATFSVPPRPSVLGLIGAFLGYKKNEYSVKLKDLKIGIKPETKIRKIRTTINLIDTKSNKLIERTQILYELLTDPKYAIAVYTEDSELFRHIYEVLSKGSPYYTPYLGMAQHIARVYDVKVEEQTRVKKAETCYVAPLEAVIGVETKQTYIVERQAYYIDTNRRATKYVDIAVPVKGKITVKETDGIYITDKGVVLW